MSRKPPIEVENWCALNDVQLAYNNSYSWSVYVSFGKDWSTRGSGYVGAIADASPEEMIKSVKTMLGVLWKETNYERP